MSSWHFAGAGAWWLLAVCRALVLFQAHSCFVLGLSGPVVVLFLIICARREAESFSERARIWSVGTYFDTGGFCWFVMGGETFLSLRLSEVLTFFFVYTRMCGLFLLGSLGIVVCLVREGVLVLRFI